MTAAADLLADSSRVHLLGGADGNANRAVRLLGQRDADLYALNLTRKRCNRVQIVHIRACMVDIPAPEHSNRDRAVLVELHRIKYNALHLKTRTRFGLKQHAVDLTAVDTGSQAGRRYRMRMRGRIRELKAARIGRNTDINALCNVGRELNTERRQHIVQHLGTAACIRPDEVFFAETVVRAVMVNDQIDLALVRLGRVRKQLLLSDIGRNYIRRNEILRRIIRHDQRRISPGDLRIFQNICALANLLQTAAECTGTACRVAVRSAVSQDENVVRCLQRSSSASNVNDHSASSSPSLPSFFSSCSTSEMCAPWVMD